MNVGQIVFIDANFRGTVQTGIIVRKEECQTREFWWYEVLCNDGHNHVIPEYLLSPAQPVVKPNWSKYKKYFKNNATLYKTHKIPVTLYT